MRLYHFTGLLGLPGILREGIARGEVPLDVHTPYTRMQLAANLTTDGSPGGQSVWYAADGAVDKTRVRLTVEVARSEAVVRARRTYRATPSQ